MNSICVFLFLIMQINNNYNMNQAETNNKSSFFTSKYFILPAALISASALAFLWYKKKKYDLVENNKKKKNIKILEWKDKSIKEREDDVKHQNKKIQQYEYAMSDPEKSKLFKKTESSKQKDNDQYREKERERTFKRMFPKKIYTKKEL